MRNIKVEILQNEIEFQKKKMYSLSQKYGISSPEVLKQSLVVDDLINQVMEFQLNQARNLPLSFSPALSRMEA